MRESLDTRMGLTGRTMKKRDRGLAGATLALYVNAGSIKANPLLSWVAWDLTVLLAVFLTVLLCFHVLRSRYLPNSVWVTVGVAVVMASGLLPGILNAYGVDKAMSFFTLTMLGMLGSALLLGDRHQRSMFLKTLAGLGVVVAVLVTLLPARVSEWSNVVTLAGTNTIATSRMILSGAIVIVMGAILAPISRQRRLLLALLAAAMILTAVNTGSRGPVLAAAFAVMLALMAAPAFARRRGRATFAVLVVAGVGLLVASQAGGQGVARITAFLGGGEDSSAGARFLFWAIAWEHTLKDPGGHGWGAFANIPAVAAFFVVDGTLYPHNVLLEVALEAGLLAAALIAALLVVSILRMMRRAVTQHKVAMYALLLFTVLNSMLSGDINDNRLMWVLVIAPWSIALEKTLDGEESSAKDLEAGQAKSRPRA